MNTDRSLYKHGQHIKYILKKIITIRNSRELTLSLNIKINKLISELLSWVIQVEEYYHVKDGDKGIRSLTND